MDLPVRIFNVSTAFSRLVGTFFLKTVGQKFLKNVTTIPV